MDNPVLFTIGHSNHPWERFVALLRQAGIAAIADVRSSPYSRFHPQFNRETLAERLNGNGIAYEFLGRELGARSTDPTCYEQGRVRYDRLARTENFRRGIEKIMSGSRSDRVALMCAEKEPLQCHRSLLVSEALVHHGVSVTHILADGRLEAHAAMLERLLEQQGLSERDLFRSREELIKAALAKQEERIAYRTKDVRSGAL